MLEVRGLQAFFARGPHKLLYYTTVQGSYILCNVIVLGYATFIQTNTVFCKYIHFSL